MLSAHPNLDYYIHQPPSFGFVRTLVDVAAIRIKKLVHVKSMYLLIFKMISPHQRDSANSQARLNS